MWNTKWTSDVQRMIESSFNLTIDIYRVCEISEIQIGEKPLVGENWQSSIKVTAAK